MIPEISASKVAGLIGLHKYQPVHEVMYELLCKNALIKQRIADLERAYSRRSFQKVVNEVLREAPIQDCISTGVREAQRTVDVTSVLEDVEAQAQTILTLRKDHLTPEVRSLLAAEVRGRVSKSRGLANENAILDAYETEREVKVVERNTKMLKKDYGSFKIIGRTDGWVASENRIVDSKDRTRMWPTVPIYDEIQLRCYMNMANANESELVERFPDGTTRHTKFLNDPEKWQAIQSGIERAVAKLKSTLEDEDELKRIVFANTVQV